MGRRPAFRTLDGSGSRRRADGRVAEGVGAVEELGGVISTRLRARLDTECQLGRKSLEYAGRFDVDRAVLRERFPQASGTAHRPTNRRNWFERFESDNAEDGTSAERALLRSLYRVIAPLDDLMDLKISGFGRVDSQNRQGRHVRSTRSSARVYRVTLGCTTAVQALIGRASSGEWAEIRNSKSEIRNWSQRLPVC